MGKTRSFSQQLIGFLHKLPHHRDGVAELVRSMVRADAARQGVGDMVSLTSQEIFDVWARARRVGAARGTWCVRKMSACSMEDALPLQTSRTKVASHRSTLETKLRLFHFVKLGSHNLSLYHSLQRQNTQKQVAHRLIGMSDFWDSTAWKAWCREIKQDTGAPKRARLAGALQRKDVRAAVEAAPKLLSKPFKQPSCRFEV